jgi:hypothetical protein
MSIYISISCAVCRRSLKVRCASIGETMVCRYCDRFFQVEAPDDPTAVTSADASPDPSPSGADTSLASFSVAVFGPKGPGAETEELDPGRSLPAVVPVFASELEARREAFECLGAERDALHQQVEQLQAEIARLSAERDEAECRHDSAVRRSEELARTIVELRDERDRHESAYDPTPSSASARVTAVELTVANARTDEGWADHRPSERFRAVVTSSAPPNGEPRAGSEWLPKLRNVRCSPFVGQGEETVERTFPREADLALVRAQVQILEQLLRTGPSSEHVLIYQRRLMEFALRIREASRLATSLASEVEQTRRRDEMQYHMYLVRRAGEIDKGL